MKKLIVFLCLSIVIAFAGYIYAGPMILGGGSGATIDDTKGNGDTTYAWSADKIFDQLALKLNATALDDTKGNGDTTFIWSADKVFDQLALKQTADSDLTTWAGITPSANLQTFLTTPNAANFETAIGGGAFASDLLGYANGAAVLSGIGAESSTSNDIDPDRLAGDTTDDNLIDASIVNITAANIEMDGSPATDDIYRTFALNGLNAGENITQWDVVYFDTTDSEYKQADNDAAGEWPAVGVAVAAGTDGNELKIVTHGPVRNDGWNWTAASYGQPIYLDSTAGGMTVTRPTAAASVIQQMGWVISDDEIFVDVKPIDWGITRYGTTAVDKVLTCTEASNTVWTVTVTAKDVTLPAVASCTSVSMTLITVGAIATDLDVNANDRAIHNGTAETDGDKMTSATAAGEQITCYYESADGVVCQSNGWTPE